MVESGGSMLVQMVAGSAPVLVACLVGLVLGAVLVGKAKTPGLLLILGCGLMIVNILGGTLLQTTLIQAQHESDWTMEEFRLMMSILGFARSFVSAVGITLLLVAAFVGRSGSRDYP